MDQELLDAKNEMIEHLKGENEYLRHMCTQAMQTLHEMNTPIEATPPPEYTQEQIEELEVADPAFTGGDLS